MLNQMTHHDASAYTVFGARGDTCICEVLMMVVVILFSINLLN